MMETPYQETHRLFSERSSVVKNSVVAAKMAILLVGLATGIAGVISSTSTGSSWSGTSVLVVIAGAVGFFAGLFLLLVEGDPQEALDAARRAVTDANELEADWYEIEATLEDYERTHTVTRSLYTAILSWHSSLEHAIATGFSDDEVAVRTAFESAHRDIRIALGFELASAWTICIYKLHDGLDEKVLRIITDHRSIQDRPGSRREWPLGVGVAGAAVAKNDEACVPNATDPATGTVHKAPLNSHLEREDDEERYRSMFAVPVALENGSKVWGCVMATSSDANHFGDKDATGDPREAARCLAGLIALTVTSCEANRASMAGLASTKSEKRDTKDTENESR